jgi:nitroimidazol reductase NimA-like FMN-containing flavoprotein (pyridoxamine 5'-phosphate oxidase superfamily)
VLIDEGLELLDEDEAMRLLASSEVGRIGLTIAALPAIFPVNYRFVDGCIMFRTAPGSKLLAAANNTVVAFEVDDYHVEDRTGWSVLVVGPSELVRDVGVIDHVLDAELEPWVEGTRASVVRIRPGIVSGRRIVHGTPLVPGG